eukprot:3290587-Amphidinium_carterae.3
MNATLVNRFLTQPVSPPSQPLCWEKLLLCSDDHALSASNFAATFVHQLGLGSTVTTGAPEDRGVGCVAPKVPLQPHPMNSQSCLQFEHDSQNQHHSCPSQQRPQQQHVSAQLDTLSVLTLNTLSMGEKSKVGAQGETKEPPPLCQPGQVTHLCELLEKEGIHLAFIQESRLVLPTDFTTTKYHVISSPAEKGIGGLLILAHKTPGTSVLHHRSIGSRVLCATVQYKGICIFAISAHAPIRRAPAVQHQEFAKAMKSALALKPQGAVLISGADMNMRLGHTSEDFTVAGDWASVCPRKAEHAQELLTVLQEFSVCLANTFINTHPGIPNDDGAVPRPQREDPASRGLTDEQHDSIATWWHPQTGKVYQIDFIMVNKDTLKSVTACHTMPWGYFDLMTSSDHRGVKATLLFQARAPRQTPRPMRKHVSAAHLQAFTERVVASVAQFVPPPEATPFDVTLQLQEIAVKDLRATKPARAHARSEWITKELWVEMRMLNALRKVIKSVVKGGRTPDCLPTTLVEWPGAPPDMSLPLEITEENLLSLDHNLLKSYAKSFTRRLRSRLRACKRAWTDAQCEHSQAHFGKREAHEAFNLIKKVSGTLPKRTGAALALRDGTVTQEPEVVRQLWLEHWQQHFTATLSQAHSFQQRNIEGSSLVFGSSDLDEAVGSGDLWITPADVRRLIARTNPRKSAPDLCPHKYWPLLGNKFEEAVAKSINACIRAGRLPDAWSGSLVVPICKRHKSALATSSHRPIQLLLAEAKLMSRFLLEHLAKYVSTSWLQYAQVGVHPPLVVCQQYIAQAHDTRRSCALAFVDITAAYDDVSHKLLFDDVMPDYSKPDLVFDGLRAAGMSHNEASATQEYIREHPHHLLHNRVPPQLRNILVEWITKPWFQLCDSNPHSADTVGVSLEMHQGIRQGDCLSTFLFCVFFDIVLARIHSFLLEVTTPLAFTNQNAAPRQMSSTPCTWQDVIMLLAFADDVLLPLANQCPKKLVVQLQKVMEHLVASFRLYGLRVNFGRSKTEICMRLTTKLAKPIMQHLRIRALDEHGPIAQVGTDEVESRTHPCIFVDGMAIRIVKTYQYLGRWTGAHTCPVQDLAVQKACAISAFRVHRRVLTSSKYTLATRIYLLKALVRCHLMQNVMTYAKLTSRQRDSISHTYVSLLKKTVMLNAPDQLLPIKDDDFLSHIGEPSWERLVAYRIVTFIPKICASQNSQVRTALSATGPSSLWTEWIPALRLVHVLAPSLRSMPAPSPDSMQAWLCMIIPAGQEWTRLARRTLFGERKPAIDLSSTHTVHAANMLGPNLLGNVVNLDEAAQMDAGTQNIEEFPIPCPLCDRRFKATKGLIVHKVRQHGVVPPLALRVRTTTCTACGAEHGTRARLLDHLRRKLSCSLHVMHTEEPMELEEYLHSVGALNAEDNLLARQLPSTGPIPCIEGVYRSQPVPACDPFTAPATVTQGHPLR